MSDQAASIEETSAATKGITALREKEERRSGQPALRDVVGAMR
jgi:hypothetical protein